MGAVRKLLGDPTFIAHGLGMLGVVGTALAGINPLFGGIIAGLTAVFHIAQTFGNGTAVPPGWGRAPASPSPDRSSAVSFDGAAWDQPHVDGPAPKIPLMNAAGDTQVQR